MAQVHKRESAAISPIRPKKVQAATLVMHTLRFVFAWDKHIGSRLWIVSSPGGAITPQNPYYGEDSIVVDVPPGHAGQYVFDPQVGVGQVLPGQIIHATFSIYMDSVLVSQQSAALAGSAYDVYEVWPNGWIYFTTPYYDTFKFNLGTVYPTLFYESCAVAELTPVNDCSGTQWDPSKDSVTLSIVSGSRYVDFHDLNTRRLLGTSVTTSASNVQNIGVVADLAFPDSSGDQIIVSATSNGIARYDTLTASPYFYKITANPPVVHQGGETVLRISGVDAAGNPHDPIQIGFIAMAYNLDLYVSYGGKYGNLWYGDTQGDTIEVGDTLTNVWSYNPRLYDVCKFLADGGSPPDTVKVQLTGVEHFVDYSLNPRLPRWVIPFKGQQPITGTGIVKVIGGDSLDHFAVTITPDTIKYSESAPIFVQAKDAGGNDVSLDASTPLTQTIDNTQYAQFIDAGADTVPSPLNNVEYGDADAQRIKVVAKGMNPIGMPPQAVTVTTTKADDPTKKGEGTIYIHCKIDPPRYSQGGNSSWGDSLYDGTRSHVSALGCALSSMAAAMTAYGDTVNPGQLNWWMKRPRMYSQGGYYQDRVNWEAIRIHSGGKVTYQYKKNPNFHDESKATGLD